MIACASRWRTLACARGASLLTGKLQPKLERAPAASTKRNCSIARDRRNDLEKRNIVLQDLLQESKDWTGLDEDHFRSAISSALELMGAEKLKLAIDSADGQPVDLDN